MGSSNREAATASGIRCAYRRVSPTATLRRWGFSGAAYTGRSSWRCTGTPIPGGGPPYLVARSLRSAASNFSLPSGGKTVDGGRVPQASRPMRAGCDRAGAASLLHFAAALRSSAAAGRCASLVRHSMRTTDRVVGLRSFGQVPCTNGSASDRSTAVRLLHFGATLPWLHAQVSTDPGPWLQKTQLATA
jgi:hypothetical protein